MSCARPVVFIVDDDISVRDSLEMLLDSAGWQATSFGSAEAFLAFPRGFAPSCLVLDIALPDINGLDLQKLVSAERAHMPIVFISGHGDIPMTVQAMRAGAIDFLTKPVSADAILQAIDKAIQRSNAEIERAAEMRSLRDRYRSLSLRERQVMTLVVTGMLNKQVAGELDISEITVKAHRGHAMKKMKARSLADMVKMSTRLCESNELAT
jgi:FixJ family two-component response regulator